jgi:hypothetical protein
MRDSAVGSKKRDRRYFRIDYTARMPSGDVYWPNAVFVTGDYRTPEGAIRGLRAIMIRDARVQGIPGRVEVEIHRLAQSNENEYHAELSLAMQAFQQHAYRDGFYVGGDSTPLEYERRLSALRRERKVKFFTRVQ